MLKLALTKADLEKGKLLKEEGWHVFELTGARSKESKDKGSMNYFLEYTGRSGEAQNVEITVLINSKVFEPMFAHLECLLGEAVDREAEELNLDLHELVGKTLDGYVVRGTDQDENPVNKIKRVAVLGTFTGEGARDAE